MENPKCPYCGGEMEYEGQWACLFYVCPYCYSQSPRTTKLKGQEEAYAAAKKLKEYADKNRGKANVFCITPKAAEQILREFYGLPKAGESPAEPAQQEGYIDLSSFL